MGAKYPVLSPKEVIKHWKRSAFITSVKREVI